MATSSRPRKRLLTPDEIQALLQQSDLSDASSDSDDGWPVPNEDDDEGSTDEHSSDSSGPSTPIVVNKQSKQTREKTWKAKKMIRNAAMTDDNDVDVLELQSPLESFFEYISIDLFEEVAHQTNLYSAQKRNHKSVKTSVNEIMKLVGLHIVMGTLKFPQAKLYWSRDLQINCFTETMSRDRLFELRNYLHFADNESGKNNPDTLWKVRPFLNPIREKCLTLPRPKHISLDEQMIPFSGRCHFRQYVPSKPNPLGLKNFVLSAPDGLVLDFAIYSGRGCISAEDISSLGVGGGVVKLLSQSVPQDSKHVIYTDRFFTSIKCAEYLLEHNIFLVGTVNSNRIGLVQKKLKSDKQLKRGEWDEYVREDDKMCVVKWKDNKCVTFLSTCVGSEPNASCMRWSKEEKKKVSIPQPAVIRMYNISMGGTDLCDRYLAYYRCSIRTKKWTVRMFTHFVDLAISNCWIYYVRFHKSNGLKKYMRLLEYRMIIASSLLKYEGNVSGCSRRGRPRKLSNSSEEEFTVPFKQRKVVNRPPKDVQFDNVGHIPRYMDDKNASKCRLVGCKSRTRIMCTKCNIYLCLLKNNCFEKFHSK